MNQTLIFDAPYAISLEARPIPTPAPDQILIKSLASAISAGTELLLYRGQMPRDLPLDANFEGMGEPVRYPLPYGYALVGEVIAHGAAVDPDWLGERVFAFQPHQAYVCGRPSEVVRLPQNVGVDDALFLPNMETAVSFVMDARPVIGEEVALFGLGVVGLLTLGLLARMPLSRLVGVDPLAQRRSRALTWGASQVAAPQTEADMAALQAQPVDLAFELSGNPQALDQAIAVTGQFGRILVGSWYGEKRAALNLGGHFHRSHQRLISSQVSEMKPEWNGRWTKARRLNVAWEMLRQLQPSRLITQRFSLADAPRAYQLLDEQPGETLQIIFDYA